MSTKREAPALADVIATVISPVLIMVMVGSLIFFLIEVLYGGQYAPNLRWTFSFFVLGAVLIARIAIEHGDARATVYAIALGFVAFLAMVRFVEFPPGSALEQFGWLVNIGLLVLVWWAARKLTWDCTHIDESKDGSDRSLLEEAGIDALDRPPEWREPPTAKLDDEDSEPDPGIAGWLERYRRYRKARDAKPHTPGVWVVYFSLAALPIYGLGQSLIPVEEVESRRFTFWLMAAYVAAGLGLLMTTSFLGLRRYLKQRKLQIPAKMAGMWLGVGSGLILLFLTIGAILPRPNSETPIIDISGAGSKDRDASDYAVNNNGEGKGDGKGGDRSSDKGESSSSTEGRSKDGGQGKGQDGSNKGSGQDQGKGGNSGKSDQSGNQKGGESGDSKKGDSKDDQKSDGEKKNNNDGSKSGSGSGSKSQSQGKQSKASSRSSSKRGPIGPSSLGKVGTILKWVVFVILALVVLFYLFRHGLKFLANFTTWAKQLLDFFRNFWNNLFGRKTEERTDDADEPAEDTPRARPFADFQNPFETGADRRQTPAQLVRYSFAALEAFGWEHDRARDPEETPIEFAARIARTSVELGTEAPRLANLYARLAYARGALPDASRDQVREFWRQLELAHDEALNDRAAVSAGR